MPQKPKNTTLDILFPKFCLNCGKEGDYICEDCSVFIGEAALICPVCNDFSFNGEKHQHCSAKFGLNGLVSIWEYEGLIKGLLSNIKYKGISDIIPELVTKAFKIITKDTLRFQSFLSFLFSENTYISFVPMYKKKEKRRGFNQAELIAREIGRIVDKKVVSLLVKTKETESQTKLNKKNRLENLKDVFEYRKSPLSFSQIVFIDDIWTTGATMKECSKVLKKAGVQKIWGLTLARTV